MKITQYKRENGIKTSKNPQKRNKFRKWMKKFTSKRKLNLLGRLSTANKERLLKLKQSS